MVYHSSRRKLSITGFRKNTGNIDRRSLLTGKSTLKWLLKIFRKLIEKFLSSSCAPLIARHILNRRTNPGEFFTPKLGDQKRLNPDTYHFFPQRFPGILHLKLCRGSEIVRVISINIIVSHLKNSFFKIIV